MGVIVVYVIQSCTHTLWCLSLYMYVCDIIVLCVYVSDCCVCDHCVIVVVLCVYVSDCYM
jgi:hypothetical protein